ncbi:hypothetical protein SETIT_7G024200v2 [Setaria italica]|uniref:Ubiquitin-like protease family profile domain-containing protein n=1 Tax=Setaria italica TaxID=4555 RepID=A0A368RT25_SETIT|nr:hypothetical protein SETIT_7G024200v2 [Setaria italica]
MAKSTIYLGNTLIVGLLQRDGKNKEKIKPNIKEDSIVERVMKYVAHDLVFLPINIEEMHWYLAVVNPKRCEIHVLGSLGPMSRDDLGHVLDGLKLQIDAALGVRDITDHKWPDLQVSLWPVVEQFYHRMQTDGCFSVSHMYINDFIPNLYKCQLIIAISTISISIIDLCRVMQTLSFKRKEWVPSSDPYPISLSLKNLQDILDVSRSMDVDVFNLAVRMLACDMAMYICGYRRHSRLRLKHDPKSLAKFFDDWPRSGVSFSECRLVVVPYYACGNFSMFVLDKHARMIAIIDLQIQKIAKTYDRAMDEIDPSWNDDIYDWNHIYLCLVPKTFDSCLTGFLVIELMNMWDGERIHGLLNVDSRLLRKWLLIEVLKSNFNESADNIPEDVRVTVCSIRNTYVEKYI